MAQGDKVWLRVTGSEGLRVTSKMGLPQLRLAMTGEPFVGCYELACLLQTGRGQAPPLARMGGL